MTVENRIGFGQKPKNHASYFYGAIREAEKANLDRHKALAGPMSLCSRG
jgi:hypothetical protein